MAFEIEATQSELILANTMHQLFYAGDCSGSAIEVLEAEHGPGSGLDSAMILLDQVVQIVRGTQLHAFGQQAIGSHLAYCAMRSCIAIEGDCVRCSALMSDCLPEEGLGCRYISSGTESKVNGLPSLVHRPVEIDPLTAYLDVGLIHSP